jgi:hypothetical protein
LTIAELDDEMELKEVESNVLREVTEDAMPWMRAVRPFRAALERSIEHWLRMVRVSAVAERREELGELERCLRKRAQALTIERVQEGEDACRALTREEIREIGKEFNAEADAASACDALRRDAEGLCSGYKELLGGRWGVIESELREAVREGVGRAGEAAREWAEGEPASSWDLDSSSGIGECSGADDGAYPPLIWNTGGVYVGWGRVEVFAEGGKPPYEYAYYRRERGRWEKVPGGSRCTYFVGEYVGLPETEWMAVATDARGKRLVRVRRMAVTREMMGV